MSVSELLTRRALPFAGRRASVRGLHTCRSIAALRPLWNCSRVNELAQESLLLLIEAARHPEPTLLEHYDSVGMHGAAGRRATDDLRARNMIRLLRLVRKGRGGQPTVVEVLEAGLKELMKRGIKPAPRVVKGGFKHEVYARLIARNERAQGKKTWFEKWFGNQSSDVLSEDTDGFVTSFEVVLSGSGSWNAQQALKAAVVAGIGQVIVACEDKKLMKSIEEQLEKLDSLGLYRKKIRVCHLAEYVS